MTGAHPFAVYLTFNGNCREAFRYYQDCFGGELQVQTLADTPDGSRMERKMRNAVITAVLENDYLKLVGTDLSGEGRLVPGNKVSILVQCGSVNERASLIFRMTGVSAYVAEDRNPVVGITDRYSVRWLLSIND